MQNEDIDVENESKSEAKTEPEQSNNYSLQDQHQIDDVDIKKTIQEAISISFESMLKILAEKWTMQKNLDTEQVIKTYVNDLNHKLMAEFQKTSYLSEQINKSLNGFITAILDRIEDPRGRFALNLQKSLISGLLSFYDLLCDFENKDNAKLTAVEHQNNYRIIRNQLLQLLKLNNIEPINPEAETQIDVQCHRVLEVKNTTESDKDNSIANCIRTGFAFGSIILRPADVVVNKYTDITQ